MSKSRYLYVESCAWSLVAVLAYLLFNHFQPIIWLNGGQAWDGTQYLGMYNYFRNGKVTHYLGSGLFFPFNQRPLVPFCASFLSAHFLLAPSRAFKILHIFSISITSGLLYLIFVKYFKFDKFISSLALIWLLSHALSYTRITPFNPFMIDSQAMLSLALLLYIVMSERYIFLPVLAVFGCLIKEQFLAFLVVMLVYELFIGARRNKLDKKKLSILAISILLDIASNYYVRHHLFIAPGSSMLTLLWWGYQRFKHPLSFVRYAVVYFVAFGPFGLLLVFYFKNSLKEMLQLDSYKLVGLYALVFIAFGLLAGADMDRILWSGFPFLMPVMLLAIRGFNRKYILAIFLCTLPLMHLVTAIPQPLAGRPNDDLHGLFSWMMEYANPGIVAMWGLYMCIIWMLIGRLRFLNRDNSTSEDSSHPELKVL